MNTNYYIVTNRSIVIKQENNKIYEFINPNGKDFPSAELRFAKYHVENKQIDVVSDTLGEINYKSDEDAGSVKIFKEIYQQMLISHKGKKDDNYDLLLSVHGFANDNTSIETHMEYLKKNYVENPYSPIEVVLVFYWTTNGTEKSIRHYYDDQDDASIAGKALARLYMKLDKFFDDVVKIQPCGNNIHLMCHSMGNQVFRKMIENISRKTVIKKNLKEIILLAPDVDNDIFEDLNEFTKLPLLADRTHVYYHRKDRVVKLSNRLNKKKRLGHGPKNTVRIEGINFIDVTETTKNVKQGGRDELGQHWFYMTIPKVIQDINNVLLSEKTNDIPNRVYLADKNIFKMY